MQLLLETLYKARLTITEIQKVPLVTESRSFHREPLCHPPQPFHLPIAHDTSLRLVSLRLAVVGNLIVAAGNLFVVDQELDVLPPIVHLRNSVENVALCWTLQRMSEELLRPQPGGVVVAHSLARMMLVQALRIHIADAATNGSGGLSALSDAQTSRAFACMQQEPALDWTVERLANQAGMSRAGFALKFKESVRQSSIEYLTRWRMLLAEDRMAGTTDSIAEIARSLGYESASAFTKAFKKVAGHSPRQHRQMLGIAANRG